MKKPGDIVHNATCCDCGDLMRTAEIRRNGKTICTRCWTPSDPLLGNGYQGHYDDDPSGASGSWDTAVRLCEEGRV